MPKAKGPGKHEGLTWEQEAASAFEKLVSTMARLRGPEGCPWDREQTHRSIAINLLEETYEVLDAIDRDDTVDLKEEMGDVLLQVVFHAEMAREAKQFDIGQLIEDLTAKLVERHPHVFGDASAGTAADVLANWESIKKDSKRRDRLEEGIPPGLPALVFADKVLRRLAGAGKGSSDALRRVGELAAEAQSSISEQVVGKLLFETAAVAKSAGIDPEGALRREAAGRLKAGNTPTGR